MAVTTIRLAAYPGRKNVERGYTSTEIALSIGGSTPTRTLQIARLEDITRAVAAFGGDLRKADPEASFAISVSVANGHRKPRGFDAADKANEFGQNAFLRSDVGADALHRKLTLPVVPAAA
jgi:hypothetical protein